MMHVLIYLTISPYPTVLIVNMVVTAENIEILLIRIIVTLLFPCMRRRIVLCIEWLPILLNLSGMMFLTILERLVFGITYGLVLDSRLLGSYMLV